ncbi:MAG: nucleotidyltransferase family protein [Armatimonadota bacterium]
MRVSIPERNETVFKEALEIMNRSGILYVIGGAFAVFHYTSIWRDTNDLDFYIERENVAKAASALAEHGFVDYGEQAAGDREWIQHSIKNDVLIDLIWQSPNHLASPSGDDYLRGPKGEFLGMPVSFLPPDVILWTKIFTMNRHRCDWPDIFSIIRACPDEIKWDELLDKMGENWPVLLSFIILFDWAFPGEATCIPDKIRKDLLARKEMMPLTTDLPSKEVILDPWIYTRPLSP